jgi:Zn-dependent protease
LAQQMAEAINPVFAVESISTDPGKGHRIRLQGQLRTDSGHAYAHIADRFKAFGYTALLRQQDAQHVVMAVPGIYPLKPGRERGAAVLFALTVLSMLFASAAAHAPDWGWIVRNPLAGLPFAVALLGILVAHELGHYFMARRVGVSASLPYFIPMPLSLFGTMGAIIRTRSPMRDRRQLLAIGAAGPLAGLIVAVPTLIFGLLRSQVQPIPLQEGVLVEGNSLLYLALKYVVFGRILPRNGYDVFLDPVAFAAWAGLLLTSVNLIPAGQLDGGHIAYALLGKQARWLNRLAIIVTAALGLVWSGWLLWTVLLVLFGQHNAEPLDDVTPLTAVQKAFAICMLVLFVLLFTPLPMTLL